MLLIVCINSSIIFAYFDTLLDITEDHDEIQHDSTQHGNNLREHGTQVNHNSRYLSDIFNNLYDLNEDIAATDKVLDGTKNISEKKEEPVKVKKPPRMMRKRSRSIVDSTDASSKSRGHPSIFALSNMKWQIQ